MFPLPTMQGNLSPYLDFADYPAAVPDLGIIGMYKIKIAPGRHAG